MNSLYSPRNLENLKQILQQSKTLRLAGVLIKLSGGAPAQHAGGPRFKPQHQQNSKTIKLEEKYTELKKEI